MGRLAALNVAAVTIALALMSTTSADSREPTFPAPLDVGPSDVATESCLDEARCIHTTTSAAIPTGPQDAFVPSETGGGPNVAGLPLWPEGPIVQLLGHEVGWPEDPLVELLAPAPSDVLPHGQGRREDPLPGPGPGATGPPPSEPAAEVPEVQPDETVLEDPEPIQPPVFPTEPAADAEPAPPPGTERDVIWTETVPPPPTTEAPAPWLPFAAAGGLALLALLPFLAGFRLFARVAAHDALQHPNRERVYRLLETAPWSTEAEIARAAALPRSTVRHHLMILMQTRLVRSHNADVPRYAPARSRDYHCPRLAALEKVLGRSPARLAHVLQILVHNVGYTRPGAWKMVQRAAANGSLRLQREGRSVWVRLPTPSAPAASPNPR